jgi:hypothetical protein
MDVYLVPVAPDRYELYCEVEDEPQEAETESPDGAHHRTWTPRAIYRRLTNAFREMLAEAERERRQGRGDKPRGTFAKLRARAMRWVAESIAEQRLLWHLRRQESATFHYPDDMDAAAATTLLRQQLGQDFEKHRFWLAVDSVGLALAALLILVPGPNFIGYYFAFRVVGHYLSLRGAKRGLSGCEWKCEPSAPLSELRQMLDVAPHAREERVQEVATRLRLEHLAGFFQRTAIPT